MSDVRASDPWGLSYGYEPYVMPKPGHEHQWQRACSAVNRTAAGAAIAFNASGTVVNWKPPGYAPGTVFRINPASEWTTILSADPKFGVDVLQQCIDYALGALDALVVEERHRKPRSKPPRESRHWLAGVSNQLITVVGLVVAGLIVAFLAYHFHWYPSTTK